MSDYQLFNRGVVFPWHCDQYGHMNVRWYAHFFDDASFLSWPSIGFDMNALVESGTHTAVVKSTTAFNCETLAGTTLNMMGRFVALGRTSVTIEQQMRNAQTDDIHASCEYVLVFCDSTSRRAVPIPQACRDAILAAGASEKRQ